MSNPVQVTKDQLENPGPTDFTAIDAAQYVAPIEDQIAAATASPQEHPPLFFTSQQWDNKREKVDGLLTATFFRGAVPDIRHYNETGEVVFSDADMIRIQIPHDPTNVNERVVTDHDKRRFKQQWERYKSGEQAQALGTPLQALKLGPAALKQLEYFGVVSVEQLAGVQLTYLGFAEVKAKAKEFLDATNGSKLQSLEEKNMELSRRLQALEAGMQAAKDTKK